MALEEVQLIHGKNEFNRSWIFFTDIEMFTDNPGGEVTSSVKYFQVLRTMIIAGVATSIKKTLLTHYLVSAKL